MEYKIDKELSSNQLQFAISPEDVIHIRQNSIVSKTANINVTKSGSGSILSYFSSSSKKFPLKSIDSKGKTGYLTIAPPLPGEIAEIEPMGDGVKVSTLFFLGYVGDGYDIKVKSGILDDNKNLGTMILSGSNESIFIYGFNGIKTINLEEGQQTKVKQDYLIGLDETVSHHLEDNFLKLVGPGTVYIHASSPFIMQDVFEKLGN